MCGIASDVNKDGKTNTQNIYIYIYVAEGLLRLFLVVWLHRKRLNSSNKIMGVCFVEFD